METKSGPGLSHPMAYLGHDCDDDVGLLHMMVSCIINDISCMSDQMMMITFSRKLSTNKRTDPIPSKVPTFQKREIPQSVEFDTYQSKSNHCKSAATFVSLQAKGE